jgi:hypothetical protein
MSIFRRTCCASLMTNKVNIMPSQDIHTLLNQIKSTQENFKVSVGILVGTLLVVYFFTYGALVDSVTSSFIWFEVITSVMMLFVLLFLKHVCFFLTRFKLGRREGYAELLAKLEVTDLSLDVEVLSSKLSAEK